MKIVEKVSVLPVVTTLDIPVQRVLDGARECDRVMVIGWKDGEFFFSSSFSDGGDCLWLMEKAKYALITGNHD